MPNVQPLSDALGCAIAGVDLASDCGDADFTVIERALHEHLVVVLPGQRMTPERFVAFARRFGRPEPHVIDQFHHPVDPNILILSNVKVDGKPIGLADGGTYFHSDYSYLDVPARCTILFAIQIPDGNAGTTFANQRRAWDDLPAATKARIEGLVCRHHYGNRDDLDEASRTAASPLSSNQKAKLTWVRHPLVRRHPHIDRKSLYAVSGSSFGIEGMGDAEAIGLLDELKRHATQPKYLYKHPYQVGDVIIWDNCSLLHSAPLIEADKPRTLWRITVKEAGPTH
ncbi:MAG TPA: TauD/TfdA family dioxygenase [Alphaproteobacteria bacterium]|nr:TauD/TfdA family dioxygenase [Alphaproteobacteria bacterium]